MTFVTTVRSSWLLVAITAIVGVGCSSSSDSGTLDPVWASSQAQLKTISDTATLQILQSNNCYGSYAQTLQPITEGQFSLAGTFTQLIGAAPGKLVYTAQLAGSLSGNTMSISVTVPSLQQVFGPYQLTRGPGASWSACLFP